MDDSERLDPTIVDKTIEDAAIRYVIEQERRLGREARDTRRRPGAPDIESGDRKIELKVVGGWLRARGLLLFTPGQIRKAEQDPDYYVYIVENLSQGDPSKFRGARDAWRRTPALMRGCETAAGVRSRPRR